MLSFHAVGLETQVRLQRRVLPADAVELGDLGHDVARCLIVAWPDLILLRIQVLLLPGIAADSHSSKPEYMPHSPEPMVASAARIRKPARPESCRKNGLMSGVLTKKFGR